jgi:hypothetical protein
MSRTSTFNVKTLAGIAQLVSYKEEPPDIDHDLQTATETSKHIAMALRTHAQEWLSHISKKSHKILKKK